MLPELPSNIYIYMCVCVCFSFDRLNTSQAHQKEKRGLLKKIRDIESIEAVERNFVSDR